MTFTFGNQLNFQRLLLANIVSYVLYFVRDVLTLILKILFNMILVYLVRNYLIKIRKEKIAFALKISSGTELHNNKVCFNEELISKTNKKQAYFAIFICLFSFFENFFATSSYLLSLIN